MITWEQFVESKEKEPTKMIRCPKCLGKKKDPNGNFCDYCGGSGKVTSDKGK